jgi:hypothetical protein
MKHIKLTVLVVGILQFGCNQITINTASDANKSVNDTIFNLPPDSINLNGDAKLEDFKIDSIKRIIALFKARDINKIASKIEYPLSREYPIPSIKNKQDFLKRFKEVFDDTLINRIANSKIEQWSEVGWRGIMLDDGIIWMANSNGVITAINYQSDFEKKLLQDLVTAEKQSLHESLKTFESAIYQIKTKNFLIRIDQLSDGNYRYASWKMNQKQSEKPSIILDNGQRTPDGSGGNHFITFTNKNFTYSVYIGMVREEGSSGVSLLVEKDGQKILSEAGTLIE